MKIMGFFMTICMGMDLYFYIYREWPHTYIFIHYD
jgi:hypothetical protein